MVLVLMSLATGLVLPQLSNYFASLQSKSELEVMLLKANGLGSLALSRGSGIVIENLGDVERELSPPDGWSVEIIEPLIVKANGFCLGGELKFQIEDFVNLIRFFPPYCDVPEAGG